MCQTKEVRDYLSSEDANKTAIAKYFCGKFSTFMYALATVQWSPGSIFSCSPLKVAGIANTFVEAS